MPDSIDDARSDAEQSEDLQLSEVLSDPAVKFAVWQLVSKGQVSPELFEEVSTFPQAVKLLASISSSQLTEVEGLRHSNATLSGQARAYSSQVLALEQDKAASALRETALHDQIGFLQACVDRSQDSLRQHQQQWVDSKAAAEATLLQAVQQVLAIV
jgi:phosphatidylinositol kinase/protein kinase (PI-3  family)